MSAALECWSGKTSNEEEMVEQVLMRSQGRSEGSRERSTGKGLKDSSVVHRKLQRLSRNVSEAFASLKNSLSLDATLEQPNSRIEICRKHFWGIVVRNLTQLYPGSQLPERLLSNIRKHYDSLPLSYSQANFDMDDVFLHIRLMEQAAVEDRPAVSIQEVAPDGVVEVSMCKLTFACDFSISWPVISGALESASISCRKLQLFEKKGSTLGIVMVAIQSGMEKSSSLNGRIVNCIQLALKKSKHSSSSSLKLPFGLCVCQEGDTRIKELKENNSYQDAQEENHQNTVYTPANPVAIQPQRPSPPSSSSSFSSSPSSSFVYVALVNEHQIVQHCVKEMQKWMLKPEDLQVTDRNSFKGLYRGKRVAIAKVKGCDRGGSYEFGIRKDLLELMTCGHKKILQFHGLCVDEEHGLCVVTKMMEGGSVQDRLMKAKRLSHMEIIRISIDVAEGLQFMNDRGVPYKDLKTQSILLDLNGNACLGDMNVASSCRSTADSIEYETDGFKWLAPEIIAGDPENVAETWMSNVYSFGMLLWEMFTGESAYNAYSPVQAAVGIATCGLRPDIPKDCPSILRSLMIKCWNVFPPKRPQFKDVIQALVSCMNSLPS